MAELAIRCVGSTADYSINWRPSNNVNTTAAIFTLFLAALFEAGGDALVRAGLNVPSASRRLGFMLAGAAVLFVYGFTVNAPGWDFGRLIGVYVVFFFLVAQLISWFAFQQKPTPALIAGGALIVAGGTVIAFWKA
jgi:drug/metabolite transporter (DMT)-like permease